MSADYLPAHTLFSEISQTVSMIVSKLLSLTLTASTQQLHLVSLRDFSEADVPEKSLLHSRKDSRTCHFADRSMRLSIGQHVSHSYIGATDVNNAKDKMRVATPW